MIDLDMIDAEIDRLEMRPTSFYSCSRLSTLYNVRDHLKGVGAPNAQIVPELDGSDFLRECSHKPAKAVLEVMDEFVQTMAITYPTTYEAIMDRIRAIV